MARSCKGQLAFTLLLAVSVALGGAGSASAAESYSDPEGLVSFSVPAGWELASERRGLRFRRAGVKERSVLSVLPKPRDPERTIDDLRATGLSQVRSQNRTVDLDEVTSAAGFQIFELRAVPGPDGRGPVSHAVRLLGPDLYVEVMLIAAPDRYPAYQPDLHAVVASLLGAAPARD